MEGLKMAKFAFTFESDDKFSVDGDFSKCCTQCPFYDYNDGDGYCSQTGKTDEGIDSINNVECPLMKMKIV
jgi:uncharacterized protein (DUF2237 family)